AVQVDCQVGAFQTRRRLAVGRRGERLHRRAGRTLGQHLVDLVLVLVTRFQRRGPLGGLFLGSLRGSVRHGYSSACLVHPARRPGHSCEWGCQRLRSRGLTTCSASMSLWEPSFTSKVGTPLALSSICSGRSTGITSPGYMC